MKLYKLSISALMRDWRSGELHLVLLAVIISVSAVTTVSFFTDRVKRATELESNTLLAADLVLASPSPINSAYDSLAKKNGLNVARTTSFRSVAVVGERLELTEVKAVDPTYPLYGELRTASELFGEEEVTDQIPASGEAWLDSRLFQLLAIDIGDSISLGSVQLRVTRVLTHEPDRGGDLFNIAPRVLINRVDLPRSGLLLPGSRAKYRLLVAGSEEAISSFRSALDDTATDNIEIQGIRDARPELKTALNRAEQFLGLAVLSSIALAGLAIALSAQRFASRHFDHCAIMRCLGMQRAT
ncbi:MAG: ABC transporter permease, partial [Gammaproteobacteria bacterium]